MQIVPTSYCDTQCIIANWNGGSRNQPLFPGGYEDRLGHRDVDRAVFFQNTVNLVFARWREQKSRRILSPTAKSCAAPSRCRGDDGASRRCAISFARICNGRDSARRRPGVDERRQPGLCDVNAYMTSGTCSRTFPIRRDPRGVSHTRRGRRECAARPRSQHGTIDSRALDIAASATPQTAELSDPNDPMAASPVTGSR